MSVFIGIGSNLDDPIAHVQNAVNELTALDGLQLMAVSSLYETAPVGFSEQANFINAVVQCQTSQTPQQLLAQLQQLEQMHGRERTGPRFGPRTLDVDILLFNDLVLNTDALTIPHPRLHERAFVLYPLAQISPDLILPDGTALQNVLSTVPAVGIDRLTEEAL